jgi:hypothetical protein
LRYDSEGRRRYCDITKKPRKAEAFVLPALSQAKPEEEQKCLSSK